jgi:hypothetical protein
MTKKIKYYRGIIKKILDKFKGDEYSIQLEWISSTAEEFSYRRRSHKYSEKCQYKLAEARMQLGNSLKYISDEQNPYRKASLNRMIGESDHIPDPVEEDVNFRMPGFDSKVKTIDYLRELLEEMKLEIFDVLENDNISERASIHLTDAINKISLAKNYLGRILYCIKKVKEFDNAWKIA